MSGSLGDGTGKWQLAVQSNTDIEVMSLIRTPDGFLTSVSDVVPKDGTDANEIFFVNPASNQNQQSFLRFTNQSDVGGFVTLSGVDDNGNPAPGTDITFSLFARESEAAQQPRHREWQQLEGPERSPGGWKRQVAPDGDFRCRSGGHESDTHPRWFSYESQRRGAH